MVALFKPLHRRISRYTIFCLLLLASCQFVFTQSLPVQVIPQVLPPPPIYFSDYANPSTVNSPLRVQITLNDLTITTREIRLRVSFEGNGISFQSNDIVSGTTPLFLEGGVPLVLTNIELAPYFQFQNITGISPDIYGQAIPEGLYQFCFEIFDVPTGSRLSQRSCVSTVVFQNEPPFLISPYNKNNIEERNPQNIVFQWTPRHINVSNVEYELSIVEIWDNVVDPQAVFLSSPPVFQVTTTATTYVYGPADPLLLSNKSYAWRVQAKALQGIEEIGLFENQGFSEIFSFSYAQTCDIPLSISHEVKGSRQANITWEDFTTEVPEFTVRYREKGDRSNEWFLSKTTANWVTLWNLKAGTTYEYQVNKKCIVTQSEWSIAKEFTTALEIEEIDLYECGISPNINVINQNPLPNIRSGEKFKAGDFPVTVREVNGSNGRFTGKGHVSLPYLKNIKIAVEFTNVLINEEKQLAEGTVITVYDPEWKNILDTGDVADVLDDLGDVFTGGDNVDIPLDYEITDNDITIADGEIIITKPDGTTETFDYDEGDTYQITDANGNTFAIDENGNITQEAEGAEGGAATSQNTDGIVSDGNGNVGNPSVGNITANGVLVVFKKGNAKYDFDEADNDFEKTRYPKAKLPYGEDYYPVHKAVIDGKTDEFLAEVTITNPDVVLDSLIFKTVKGAKITTRKIDDKNIAITIKGSNSYRSEEAIITYKDKDGKYKIAASFFIHHIKEQELVNVVVVSVNGAAHIPGLESELNKIYEKAGAKFKIVKEDALQLSVSDWDTKTTNGLLDYDGSGLLSDYPKELKNIHQKYKRDNPDYDAKAYHLFLLPDDIKLTKALSGFMPKTRQWGYIFNAHKNGEGIENKYSQDLVAAHELGHGIFTLAHPFQNDDSTAGSGTNWLMDYGRGNQLPYAHWATMGDESLKLGLFQDDEDGQSAIITNIEGLKKFANPNGTFTFLSMAGKPITLPADIKEVIFSTGDTYKVNNCSDFRINPLGTLKSFKTSKESYTICGVCGSDEFSGYFKDITNGKCSSKYEDIYTSSIIENAIVGYPRISISNTNIYFKVGKIPISVNENGYVGVIKDYRFLADKLGNVSSFEDINVTFKPDFDTEVKQFIANNIGSGFDGTKFYNNDVYVFIHATQLQEHQILKGCFKTGVPGEVLKNIVETIENKGREDGISRPYTVPKFKNSYEQGANIFNMISLANHWEEYNINYYQEIAKKVKDFSLADNATASDIIVLFGNIYGVGNLSNIASDNWDCFWDKISFKDRLEILKAFTVQFIKSDGDYIFQKYYDYLRNGAGILANVTQDDIGNGVENIIYKIFKDADGNRDQQQQLLDLLKNHNEEGKDNYLILKGIYDMLNDEFVFDTNNPQLHKVVELINKWLVEKAPIDELKGLVAQYDAYSISLKNEFDLAQSSSYNVVPLVGSNFLGIRDLDFEGPNGSNYVRRYQLSSDFNLSTGKIDIDVLSNVIDYSQLETYFKFVQTDQKIFENNYSPYDYVILDILDDFKVTNREFKRNDKIIVPAVTLHWIATVIDGKNEALALRVLFDAIAIATAPATAGGSLTILYVEIGAAALDILIITNEEKFIETFGQDGLKLWNGVYGLYNLAMVVRSIGNAIDFKLANVKGASTLANDGKFIEKFSISTKNLRRNADAILQEGTTAQIKEFIEKIDDVLAGISSGKFSRVENVTNITEELLSYRIQLFMAYEGKAANLALQVKNGNLVLREGENTLQTFSKISFSNNTISLTGNIDFIANGVQSTKIATLSSASIKSNEIATNLQYSQNGKMIAGDVEIVQDVVSGKYFLKPILKNTTTTAEVIVAATNPKNITWSNTLIGHNSATDAKTFWNTTNKEHTYFIKDSYIIKVDNIGSDKTGTLIFGKFNETTSKGDFLGIYEGIHNVDVIADFTFERLLNKLKNYHGECIGGSCVNLNLSSGANIISNPEKTATIVGNYKRYPWYQGDMKELIPELIGDLKTQQFGPKIGGYNVLNVSDEFIGDWNKFWENYNLPWLTAAINREDDIWAASSPMDLSLLFTDLSRVPIDAIKTPKNLADYLNKIASATNGDLFVVGKLTGFGREVSTLSEYGYVYNSITFKFVKEINSAGDIKKLWKSIDETLGDFRGKIGTYYEVNVTSNSARQRVGVSVMNDDILELHLKIPEELQGQGIGSQIVKQAIMEDSPRAIKGWWKKQDIYSNGESVNLTIFKNGKANNLSDMDAALQTPSGKIFAREGFGKVEVIKNTPDEVIMHFFQ